MDIDRFIFSVFITIFAMKRFDKVNNFTAQKQGKV